MSLLDWVGAIFIGAWVLAVAGFVSWKIGNDTGSWIIRRREEKKYPQQIVSATVPSPTVWSSQSIRWSSASLTGIGEPASDPVTLEETWSPEKIEAWRVIPVVVKRGDPDGLWLGFPHPDGGTPDVMVPWLHPVGEKLKAECGVTYSSTGIWAYEVCSDVPGVNCKSHTGKGCGYYAYKTREQAVAHMSGYGGHAIAKVHLSGKVIEHEGGYRAEILEVVEVEAPPTVRGSSPIDDLMMQQWIAMTRAATNFALGTSVKKDDPYKDIANGGI